MHYSPLGRHIRNHKIRVSVLLPCGLLLLLAGFPHTATAESFQLDEPAADTRVYAVKQSMTVLGVLTVTRPEMKPLALPMKATAILESRQRRLAGRGRNALAYRSLRFYDKATVKATVAGTVTSRGIDDNRRLIVAAGETGGPMFYSPSGSMKYEELELLKMPGDILSLLALLPGKKVSVGDTWSTGGWAAQMLTGTEAAETANLTCKLESVTNMQARISFQGNVKGARDGAATQIEFTGHFIYNRKRGYIQKCELTQKDISKEGPIAPAMNVTATMVLERTLTENAGPLRTTEASKIPLEPNEALLRIRFDAPGKVRFHHSRRWHVHHQSASEATLRLLEQGNFIAQVNIKLLPPAAQGKHVPEKVFQSDIREALGTQLQSITKAEDLKTDGKLYLYRVTAVGKVKKTEMQWNYYLAASPSGRQMSLTFTVEKQFLKPLGNNDEAFVTSIEFPKP
jgi:hypothetical protein